MSLIELLGLLRKHLVLVIGLPVGFAIAVAVGSRFIPNQYTATTSMYVLSKNDETQASLSQSELAAGQMLTNDVATILNSDRMKSDVAQKFGLKNLSGFKLAVTSSTSTRVITLKVTATDPKAAADVANALAADVSDVAKEVMQIEAVNVIDPAKTPTSPSGPRRTLYTMMGFVAGLFLATAYVVVQDMLDTRVKNGSTVEEMLGVPVVGHFPALERS